MRPRLGPVVFDAYGTLFDLVALAAPLERRFPGRGLELALVWRATQIRHTWLRSLIGAWADFDVVTRDALAQTLAAAGLRTHGDATAAGAGADGARADGAAADDGLLHELLTAYRRLPPYPDVREALSALEPDRPRGVLTNGRRSTVEATIRAAGLSGELPVVLSVEDVRIYKPAPAVYALATARFEVRPSDVTFVSGNAWDCAGAAAFGFRVIRVRRSSEVAEAVAREPDITIDDLRSLPEMLRRS